MGRKEVTKSLHTKQPRDAVRLRSRLDSQLEQLFQACRMEAISPEHAIASLHSIIHGQPQPQAPPSADHPPIVIIPSRRRGKRLSEAVEVYCKENQHGWTAKTAREFGGIYDRLIKGLSDPWLQDIDRPALVEYRDRLVSESKHVKTINKYLQILSTVLRHAGRLKWITGNPAEGLGLKDARRDDEIRRAYTLEEIKQIFSVTILSLISSEQNRHPLALSAGRGFLKSVVSLSLLVLLHFAQSTWRLVIALLPPLDRGIMWSTSRGESFLVIPHKAHLPPDSFNTWNLRLSGTGSVSSNL